MEQEYVKTVPSSADEVSIKDLIARGRKLVKYLLSKWFIILAATILGGAIGFWYAMSRPVIYTSECTFVLGDGGNQGGLGAYSGLAAIVGVGGNTSAGLFQGDNIIELYKSRLMIETALLTSATFNGKHELLIDRYIAKHELRNYWKDQQPEIQNISFDIPKEKFTIKHDSVMTNIINDINAKSLIVSRPDKKLSIISVVVNSTDELFAKALNDVLVNNVNTFYTDTKTKNTMENVRVLQHQADSVRRILNSSIGSAASSIDANPNPNPSLQVLRVPAQRKQIDVTANQAIYAQVVQNLEIARVSLMQEKPLIQVIDKPVLPLPKEKVSKKKGLLVGAILFTFLTVLVLTVRRIAQIIMA